MVGGERDKVSAPEATGSRDPKDTRPLDPSATGTYKALLAQNLCL